jgi:hypothetical protein
MADIEVRAEPADDGWTLTVTVAEGDGRTEHTVTLTSEAYNRLSGGQSAPEELVRRSFEFLLEREPKESILREFDLTVISRYFPEYEAEIRGRLGG